MDLSVIQPSFIDNLKLFIREEVNNILKEYAPPAPLPQSDGYLTPKEAREYLRISNTTLHDWCNKGILTKQYIGGQPRFKKCEIDAAFLTLKVGGKNG